MTGSNPSITIHSREDHSSRAYFHHSSAQRISTDSVLAEALRTQYPNLNLIIAPQDSLHLLSYASAGFATATPLDDSTADSVYGATLKWRTYIPPSRRLDSHAGVMVDNVIFGKFMYKWKDQEFILYIASGRDGSGSYPQVVNHYILTSEVEKVDELIKEATEYGAQLHDEVWVFDGGYWQKSRELWNSIENARWENVILEEGMKKAIISDVENFFDGQDTYSKLRVPWKRGIIYYGPPGNGKTISIKAMMHALYQRGRGKDTRITVPTLYVRSLSSYAGPEASLSSIFLKARQQAPCYLVFEDLDSIVNDSVRSYFLNEVDGLKSNDGILMVGSTNHLDRLDPGISKRPSRFDRKYYFPDPDFDQRVKYCHFWQGKLKDNEDIEFPDELCKAIAQITNNFSFAYMQEAFVAALLAIAAGSNKGDEQGGMERWAGPEDELAKLRPSETDKIIQEMEDKRIRRGFGPHPHSSEELDLEKLVLWKEIKRQIRILREEMDEKKTFTGAQAAAKVDEAEELIMLRQEVKKLREMERELTQFTCCEMPCI
ncbi:ATP-dependent Zn protease-like protein [Delitschia confertaspora ATCC 74209]|uniref:ATP-dependent Zn protease-like protein n=1 Tax=Delitschia confertaspora ATCC 74209 TaxID=1513339 RepID=A0A9P4MZ47_9PLEO|nr:ATP-dependent Zn protease-like protein [Delitschia confertaspora ATCC 74209]